MLERERRGTKGNGRVGGDEEFEEKRAMVKPEEGGRCIYTNSILARRSVITSNYKEKAILGGIQAM